MEQQGYVTEITDNTAKIRVDRESACGGHCMSCKGCPTTAVIVKCSVDDSIKVGDTVILNMQTAGFFKNAFWGYGFVTILIICGAILGYIIKPTEGISVLGAGIGLVLGLIFVKLLYTKQKTEITVRKG